MLILRPACVLKRPVSVRNIPALQSKKEAIGPMAFSEGFADLASTCNWCYNQHVALPGIHNNIAEVEKLFSTE